MAITTSRRASAAAAGFALALSCGVSYASGSEMEAEAAMMAVSMPAGVLDAAPTEGAYGSDAQILGADGKPVKGPFAPEGPAQEFRLQPEAVAADSTPLVGTRARKDQDLLQDPSLSADHGAPDVRLAPGGPATGGRSR